MFTSKLDVTYNDTLRGKKTPIILLNEIDFAFTCPNREEKCRIVLEEADIVTQGSRILRGVVIHLCHSVQFTV